MVEPAAPSVAGLECDGSAARPSGMTTPTATPQPRTVRVNLLGDSLRWVRSAKRENDRRARSELAAMDVQRGKYPPSSEYTADFWCGSLRRWFRMEVAHG